MLFSHLHPDHYFDISGLYVLWKYHPEGARPRIPVWGPKGVGDQCARAYGLRKDPGMSAEFDFHEYDDEPLRLGPFTITVREVVHPITAYGFRVEADGAVLVYSGDTGPCQEIVDLAGGADLFLAESAFVESGDQPGRPAHDRQAGRRDRRGGRRLATRAHPRARRGTTRRPAAARPARCTTARSTSPPPG